MPNFKFNFDDIPDNVPPEGEVEAVIEEIELRYGRDSGKPYLNWTFQIVEGDYAKSKIWMITSLSDNALFRLKQIAEQLGFEGLFELEVNDTTNLLEYPQLTGTAVTLDIYHEDYQGRKTARVANIVDYHTLHHLDQGDAEEFYEESVGEPEPEVDVEEEPTPAPRKTRRKKN